MINDLYIKYHEQLQSLTQTPTYSLNVYKILKMCFSIDVNGDVDAKLSNKILHIV